jgi:glyoxylase-like metal-dependent hydrolase (beta-lactamase superfamily II)
VKEIAPDVWQLGGLPPNGINVYVIGDVLIDAATKRAGKRILKQVEGRRISEHALTHVHPDHQGASAEVCEALGIPLACHADDVDAMEGRRPVQESGRDRFLNKVIRRYWEGPPHKVDRVLNDGDEVGGFRVIHAPGHQRGEVIFFRESDRVAIAGDVINTMNIWTGLPSVREPPELFTLDPEENRRSIRKLLDLNPSLVCVGHGAPLRKIEKLERLVERLPEPTTAGPP